MNIIEYVKSCISGIESSGVEQITSIIALVLLGVLAVFVLWRMFKGFRCGARRQVLSTVMILISVVISMILTRLGSSLLIGLVTVENIQKLATSLVGNTEGLAAYIDILSEFPEETVQYIFSIPVAVILAPILFMIVYGVVRFIAFIVQLVIKSVVKVKKPQNIGERLAGLCLGAVEAVIVFSVTILPVTSIAGFADEVITAITSSNGETADGDSSDFAAFEEAYATYIEPIVISSPALWVANQSVNNTVIGTISSVSTSGGEENIREEFIDIIEIAFVDIPGLKDVDFSTPDEEEKELISVLIDRLGENGIVTTVLAGTISTTAKIMDPATFGLDFEPPLDTVVNDVMNLLKTCTTETFKSDLHLIKDIYFLLADEQILTNIKNSDLLLDALIAKDEGEDKSAVQKLIAMINDNERTKPLITTLTKLSITMLASQLGNNADSEFLVEETYENLKNTMNDVLAVDSNNYETREEYIDAVTDTLDSNLQANGIVIEEREILTNIAEYIDENYGDSTELSDEEFNDVLLSYFDAYLEYQNNGTIPDDIPGLNPDNISGGTGDTPDGVHGANPDDLGGDGFNPDSLNPQP